MFKSTKIFKSMMWVLATVCMLVVTVITGNIIAGSAGAEGAAETKPPWVGFWSGKGVIWQKVLDEPVRKMKRWSEVDFWFTADPMGNVTGEGFVSYQAELAALGWDIPIANIKAEVSGSSGKEFFKIGIAGKVGETLSLKAVGPGGGPEDGNFTIPGISFNFEIQASVVLPAGTAMSPTDLSKQIYTIPIPAKGWSPFQGLTPKVEGGKGMPSRASVTSKGDKFYIMWYAVKNSN